MLLEEPTSQEIQDVLDDLDEDSDKPDRIKFETEVICLEQHIGVKLHKLLEDYHV